MPLVPVDLEVQYLQLVFLTFGGGLAAGTGSSSLDEQLCLVTHL